MTILPARNQSPTAHCHDHFLHSRYAPEKEASKLMEAWSRENPDVSGDSLLIVLDPGLGYILKEIRKRYPSTPGIVLFFSSDTYGYCRDQDLLKGISAWHPAHTAPLDQFLSENLKDHHLKSLRILEWKASENCFPRRAEKVKTALLNFLKILQGNTITSDRFASRWLSNGFRNFLRNDYSLVLSEINRPVVLAASGPSLNQHIPDLLKNRDRYTIAALPSSVRVLVSSGVRPDLIITTDPGYYASEHYRFFPSDTLIAAPVTMYPGLNRNPAAGLYQDSFVEQLVFRHSDSLSLRIPEMGTVAATALHLLSQLCRRKIYILGLDLCLTDILEHARPHSFDSLILNSESRLHPGLQCFFSRAAACSSPGPHPYRLTRSMNTYSAWFNSRRFTDQFIRIDPTPVELPIKTMDKLPCSDSFSRGDPVPFRRNSRYPNYPERKNRIEDLTSSLLQDASLMERFVENLFPSEYGTLSTLPEKEKMESLQDMVKRAEHFIIRIRSL